MPRYYNKNSEFGLPGPFSAASREALADEMASMFSAWAEESWNNLDDDREGHDEYVAAKIDCLRRHFIAGLEETKTGPRPKWGEPTVMHPVRLPQTAWDRVGGPRGLEADVMERMAAKGGK